MINELCKRAHDNAVAKGFYERDRGFPELIALIHSEVSEALEADRHESWCGWEGCGEVPKPVFRSQAQFERDIKDTVEDELADACIRIFDLCGNYGIDLEAHILAKMAYNETRPLKHGKRY